MKFGTPFDIKSFVGVDAHIDPRPLYTPCVGADDSVRPTETLEYFDYLAGLSNTHCYRVLSI